MKKNKLSTVIIATTLVSILSVTPAFSQEKQKTMRINNIKQVGIGLTIVDKTAYVYAECCTYDSMNISVKAELQINENGSWKTIKTYSDSANGKECIITAEPTIKAGTYRVLDIMEVVHHLHKNF